MSIKYIQYQYKKYWYHSESIPEIASEYQKILEIPTTGEVCSIFEQDLDPDTKQSVKCNVL